MFNSKYDTSAMRIHMEFTRKAVKRLGRVNQRKGEKLLPDQVIREMAEYKDEVKALLKAHGAERLPDIDPKEYPAMMQEAGEIGA